MDETDAFFTQTVVGSPVSVMLGRRRPPGVARAEGLEVNLQTGENALSRLWKDWVVLSHACDPVGQPRLRPGRLRGFLERHALWLGALGLCSFAASLFVWGVILWS